MIIMIIIRIFMIVGCHDTIDINISYSNNVNKYIVIHSRKVSIILLLPLFSQEAWVAPFFYGVK